jgi:hypothetical protein
MIFILFILTNKLKNSFLLILKLLILKQLINNLKMNFYEQKHQNRIDFTSAWFSILM